MIANGFLIVCGILMMAFGMRTAFGKSHPENTIGAFLALAGLVISLLGMLLICVPDFFS